MCIFNFHLGSYLRLLKYIAFLYRYTEFFFKVSNYAASLYFIDYFDSSPIILFKFISLRPMCILGKLVESQQYLLVTAWNPLIKVNESRYNQHRVTPHFSTGQNLLKKYWEKINIAIIILIMGVFHDW